LRVESTAVYLSMYVFASFCLTNIYNSKCNTQLGVVLLLEAKNRSTDWSIKPYTASLCQAALGGQVPLKIC